VLCSHEHCLQHCGFKNAATPTAIVLAPWTINKVLISMYCVYMSIDCKIMVAKNAATMIATLTDLSWLLVHYGNELSIY
jgi:hypothetical protein